MRYHPKARLGTARHMPALCCDRWGEAWPPVAPSQKTVGSLWWPPGTLEKMEAAGLEPDTSDIIAPSLHLGGGRGERDGWKELVLEDPPR